MASWSSQPGNPEPAPFGARAFSACSKRPAPEHGIDRLGDGAARLCTLEAASKQLVVAGFSVTDVSSHRQSDGKRGPQSSFQQANFERPRNRSLAAP